MTPQEQQESGPRSAVRGRHEFAKGYKDTWLWNFGFSSYWFATAYKWFILLLVVIPSQVSAIVPGGEKNSTWGLVYGAGAIWAVVGPALFGGWSDRFDSRWGHRQPFIAAGALITVVGLAFMNASTTILMLVIGYFLLQLGEDVGQGPYAAMMPEVVPPERAGRASAIMNLLQSGARLVSGIVYTVLKTTGLVYLAVGIVQLVGAGLTLYTVRDVRRATPVSQLPQEPFVVRWLAVWKSPDFRWVWFTRFMSTLGFTMISTYVLFYLEDMFHDYHVFHWDLGSPKMTAVVIAMMLSFFGMVGSVIASRLADSWGRKPLIYISGVVIFCVLAPFAVVRDITTIVLLTVPFGIAFGMYVSADWALATDVLPDKRESGTQMGVWSMSVTSVQLVAGPVGLLIDAGNRIQMGLGYRAMIWAAGIIFVASTFLIRMVKSSR
ncbi:MAG: MFS transporter [Armatimonadetes bacterium]|nr:MFS transporter [Armatimonadota bacterium]